MSTTISISRILMAGTAACARGLRHWWRRATLASRDLKATAALRREEMRQRPWEARN